MGFSGIFLAIRLDPSTIETATVNTKKDYEKQFSTKDSNINRRWSQLQFRDIKNRLCDGRFPKQVFCEERRQKKQECRKYRGKSRWIILQQRCVLVPRFSSESLPAKIFCIVSPSLSRVHPKLCDAMSALWPFQGSLGTGYWILLGGLCSLGYLASFVPIRPSLPFEANQNLRSDFPGSEKADLNSIDKCCRIPPTWSGWIEESNAGTASGVTKNERSYDG